MCSGFPPRFQGSPALGEKDALEDATVWGETPRLPAQGPLPDRLPAHAPSRRGARDLPRGIPAR